MRERLWQKYHEDIATLDQLAPVTLQEISNVYSAKFAESCAEANVQLLCRRPLGTVATYLDHKLSLGASAETIRCIVAAICMRARSL